MRVRLVGYKRRRFGRRRPWQGPASDVRFEDADGGFANAHGFLLLGEPGAVATGVQLADMAGAPVLPLDGKPVTFDVYGETLEFQRRDGLRLEPTWTA